MLEGRHLRLQKKTREAKLMFGKAKESNAGWDPLVHFCIYELGYSTLYLREYDESRKHWEVLARDNDWSKAYYTYMRAICEQKVGMEKEAQASFAEIPGLLTKSKKINGRQVPIDRFVARKTKEYGPGSGRRPALQALEIAYVWNGFSQTPRDVLQLDLNEALEWQRSHADGDHDEQAVVNLIVGALHSQLHNDAEAEACFAKVEAGRKKVSRETWTCPYARYEMGMLWLRVDGGEASNSERARKKLKHAAHNKGDFNHDLQLHLRVHLAMYELGGDADTMREQLVAAGVAAEAEAKAAVEAAATGSRGGSGGGGDGATSDGGGGGGGAAKSSKPVVRKVVEL